MSSKGFIKDNRKKQRILKENKEDKEDKEDKPIKETGEYNVIDYVNESKEFKKEQVDDVNSLKEKIEKLEKECNIYKKMMENMELSYCMKCGIMHYSKYRYCKDCFEKVKEENIKKYNTTTINDKDTKNTKYTKYNNRFNNRGGGKQRGKTYSVYNNTRQLRKQDDYSDSE